MKGNQIGILIEECILMGTSKIFFYEFVISTRIKKNDKITKGNSYKAT
ncbi:MAG: hypothetical protein SFU98_06410 [Leptospiraceae bacterium]|nr:hypothetical protein [Leptospiraceae bacterium]